MKKYLFYLFILCCYTYNNSSAQIKAVHIEKLMKQYAGNGQFNGVVLVAEKAKSFIKKLLVLLTMNGT
jgi:hypothetical protein